MSVVEARNGRVDMEVPTDEDAKQCARLLKEPHSSLKSVDLRRGLVTSAGAGAIAKALRGEKDERLPACFHNAAHVWRVNLPPWVSPCVHISRLGLCTRLIEPGVASEEVGMFLLLMMESGHIRLESVNERRLISGRIERG